MSTGFWLCSFLQTPLVMLSTHSLGLFVPGKQRANSPGYSNPFLTLCSYLEKCFDRRNEKLGHFRFRRKFLEHYVKQGLGVILFMALPPKKKSTFSAVAFESTCNSSNSLSSLSAEGTKLLRVHSKMGREGETQGLFSMSFAGRAGAENCPFQTYCLILSSQNLWDFIC